MASSDRNNGNISFAIIPHAKSEIAVRIRAEVFAKLPKNAAHIVYICADHGNDPTTRQCDRMALYQAPLNSDGTIMSSAQRCFTQEHSYRWVQPELTAYFPVAAITVWIPGIKGDRAEQAGILDAHCASLQNGSVVVIVTVDFTHVKNAEHGESLFQRYGDARMDPIQYRKMLYEHDTLLALIHGDLPDEPCQMDALFSVQLFLILLGRHNPTCARMRRCGEVIAYADSTSARFIDEDDVAEDGFVSYAGIVYYNDSTFKHREKDSPPLRTEARFALDMLESVLSSRNPRENGMRWSSIPRWSTLYDTKWGIFVGTKVLDDSNNMQTNCSYGNFHSCRNLFELAAHCVDDAEIRWKLPYLSYRVQPRQYKVEFVQPIESWKRFDDVLLENGSRIQTIGQLANLNLGTELYLPKNNARATFLPSVAKEHEKDWTLEMYFQRLCEKAGVSFQYVDMSEYRQCSMVYTTIPYFRKREIH